MRSGVQKFAFFLTALLLGAAMTLPTFAAGKSQSFTGEVSDAMCGAKHAMAGSSADCTRACVNKGSSYALVVGDKVYTLESKDAAILDQLDKLAGAKAEVSGKAEADNIMVSSVAAAK